MTFYDLTQTAAQVQSTLNAVSTKADKTDVVAAVNGRVTYNAAQKKITITNISL